MRMLAKTLLVAGLGLAGAHGQTLKMRGAMVTPELKAVYDAPEYEALYEAAGRAFEDGRPEQAFVGVAWDSRKQMVWLVRSQQQILAYIHAFEALKHELDAAVEDRQVRSHAERAAAISLIEDRLTAENIQTLNGLVEGLDLGTLFVGNHSGNGEAVGSAEGTGESAPA